MRWLYHHFFINTIGLVVEQFLNRTVFLTEFFFNQKIIKMKHLIKPGFLKYSFLLFLLTVSNAIAWAQDSTVTATTTTATSTSQENTWYTEPWVFVVGAAVLILLIIALTRGNSGNSSGRTDKVVLTKTTTSDSV